MKQRSIIYALFLLLQTIAFAEDAAFISKPGNYSLYEGELQIRVTEAEGTIFFLIGTQRFLSGNTSSDPIAAKANWFLLPVSKNEVWVYHGAGPLHLVTILAGAVSYDHSNATPALLAKAPPSVLERMARK